MKQTLVLLAAFFLCTAAAAQQKPQAAAIPDAPGRDVLMAKCFQCHSPNMWVDQRQDRRAWESALYRMVGRGALWTQDDIRQMADFLAAEYGKPR